MVKNIVYILVSSFLVMSCGGNEFNQNDPQAKATGSSEVPINTEISTPATEEEINSVIDQMNKDIDESVLVVKEPMEEVLLTEEMSKKECADKEEMTAESNLSSKVRRKPYKSRSNRSYRRQGPNRNRNISSQRNYSRSERNERSEGKCRKLVRQELANTYKCNKRKKRAPQSQFRRAYQYMVCLVPKNENETHKTVTLAPRNLRAMAVLLQSQGRNAYMGPCKEDIQAN